MQKAGSIVKYEGRSNISSRNKYLRWWRYYLSCLETALESSLHDTRPIVFVWLRTRNFECKTKIRISLYDLKWRLNLGNIIESLNKSDGVCSTAESSRRFITYGNRTYIIRDRNELARSTEPLRHRQAVENCISSCRCRVCWNVTRHLLSQQWILRTWWSRLRRFLAREAREPRSIARSVMSDCTRNLICTYVCANSPPLNLLLIRANGFE